MALPAKPSDNTTYGDPIVLPGGAIRYILDTAADFDLADLQAIDAAAKIDWEWTELDPELKVKPGIFFVSSSSGTFETDALTSAKVHGVESSRVITRVDESQAMSAIPTGSTVNPLPPIVPGDPQSFGLDVMWPHRVIELEDAHAKGIDGTGVKIWTDDSGRPVMWRYRKATVESLGFAPMQFSDWLEGLTPVGVTGDLVFNITNNNVETEVTATFNAATDAQAIDVRTAVRLATNVPLPANTAAGSKVGKTLTADANGLLVLDVDTSGLSPTDGVDAVNGDRVLVKNEANGSDNGVYVVTDAGSAGTPYILTRATDADEDAEVVNRVGYTVTEGDTLAGIQLVLTTADPITVDTTAQSYRTKGEVLLIAQAKIIDDAITASATSGYCEMAYVNNIVGFDFDTNKYFMIGCDDTTSSGKVEIVEAGGPGFSDQTVLDGLGFIGDEVGLPNGFWHRQDGVFTWALLKYLKPDFDHPAFNTSNFDEAHSKGNSLFVFRNIPSGQLELGSGILPDDRNAQGIINGDGTQFTLAPVGTADEADRWRYTGLHEGMRLTIVDGADAGETRLVGEITYLDGASSNEVVSFTVSPPLTGSQSGVTYYIDMGDSSFPTGDRRYSYMDIYTHGTCTASVIAGQRGLGVAPGATLGFFSSGWDSAALIEGWHAAIAGGANVTLALSAEFLLAAAGGNEPILNSLKKAGSQLKKAGINVAAPVGNQFPVGLDSGGFIPHFFRLDALEATITVGVSALGPTNNSFDADPDDEAINLDAFAYYSNFGFSTVDVAAPGSNANVNAPSSSQWANLYTAASSSYGTGMLKTDIDAEGLDEYPVLAYGGTSAAAAMVSGMFALIQQALKSRKRPKSQTNIAQSARQLLVFGAEETGSPAVGGLPGDLPGKDKYYGNGRVNARISVNKALQLKG